MKREWKLTYKKQKVKIIKNVYRLKSGYYTVPEYDAYINGKRIIFGNVYTKARALQISKDYVNKPGKYCIFKKKKR